MKKILMAFAAISMLVSCGNPELEEKLVELQSTNDSLLNEQSSRDSTINSYMANLNDIERNLTEITKLENQFKLNYSDPESQQTQQEKIAEDISLINEMMLKNKKKINSLLSKLNKSNIRIKELEVKLENMQKMLEAKDAEIAGLRDELAKVNEQLAELFEQYKAKLQEIDNAKGEIEEKTEEINTAYYAYGSKKELKENGVISKDGGVAGLIGNKSLNKDFNEEYFTKINITQFSTLDLNTKKAEIMTNHPTDSYEFLMDGKMVSKLVIKDPKKFWSVSKYLVVIAE